jgi:hypothetical protein
VINIKIAMPRKTVICTHFSTTPKRLSDLSTDPSELEKNTNIEKIRKEVVINKNPRV